MAYSEADFAFNPEVSGEIAIGLLRRGEVGFGDYTLRDGSWSPIYVDLRPTASAVEHNAAAPDMTKAEQLRFRDSIVLGYAAMANVLAEEVEHIAGIPEAVLGLAPMVAYELNASYFQRRIVPKGHGKSSDNILADFNPGDRVLLLDDLISSSGAKVDEKNLLEKWTRDKSAKESEGLGESDGIHVAHACIILDRETGGIQKAAEHGLQIHAGITLTQVLEIGNQEGLIPDSQLRIVSAYRAGKLTRKEDAHLFA